MLMTTPKKPLPSDKSCFHRPASDFPVLRRSFVADKTVLTIKNGMLTTVNVERPSSVAGAVGIPKAVLQALALIPLELRQNTTNNVNAIFDMKEAKEKLRSRD